MPSSGSLNIPRHNPREGAIFVGHYNVSFAAKRLSPTTFTLLHVGLSLVGVIAGLVVAGGLVAGKRLDGWTGVFLVTTVLTNVSGFGFPFVTFLPSHAVGIVSLVVLPVVISARYWKHLAGAWRGVYVVGAVLVLYLNVFVLVVQLFRRLPALIATAPTQKEPPFLVTQLVVLALFIALGRAAAKGFRADDTKVPDVIQHQH